MRTLKTITSALVISVLALIPIKAFSQFFISGGYQGGGHGSGGFTTGIQEEIIKATTSEILVFPNPFTDRLTINIKLGEETKVRLDIYDISNRLVCNIIPNSSLSAGRHIENWGGNDRKGNAVPRGVYYCRMVADENVLFKKIIKL